MQHYFLRTCSAAVKKARAFEVQRTVKKLKSSTNDVERIGLQDQLEAIKTSNHVEIAAIAIRSKLTKSNLLPKGYGGDIDEQKELAKYPMLNLIKELQDQIPTLNTKESVNVEIGKAKAKLLSSKLVSEEVTKAVKDLSSLLSGKPVTSMESKDGNASKTKVESSTKRPTNIGEKTGRATGKVSGKGEEVRGEPSDDSSEGDEESMSVSPLQDTKKEDARKGMGTLDPKKTTKRQDAPSIEGDERSVKKMRRNEEVNLSKESTVDDDDDDDDDGDRYYSDDEDSETPGHFPALTTGFVAGKGLKLGRASDDEWSDGDADLDSIDEEADEVGRKKDSRKNRMGQQARRALWEKKFGKQANHLKLLEKEPKRAGRGVGDAKFKVVRGQVRPPQSDTGWSSAPGRAPLPSVTPAPINSKPKASHEAEMHPSWIAKQQQKERAEAALRGGGTSKKIVFD
ncbi:hypothetical protein CBS101457_000469 [Exobasidium rhododendri]|nr:hypothetical protein CBS101457_000469 [Exobasidium rhododendri]